MVLGKCASLTVSLGEMHYSPIADDSGFRLPRDGGVAFVAQEGWVQSGTIKVNDCSLSCLTDFINLGL